MKEDNIFSSLGDSADNTELRKAIADLYPYSSKDRRDIFYYILLDRESQSVYACNRNVLMATKVAIPDDFPSRMGVRPARLPEEVIFKEPSSLDPELLCPMMEILSRRREKINGVDFDFVKRAVEVSRRKHILEDKNNKIEIVFTAVYDDKNKLRGFLSPTGIKGLTQAKKDKDATFYLGDRLFFAEWGNSTFVATLNQGPAFDGLMDSIEKGESELSFLNKFLEINALYITRENVATFEKIENEREAQRDTYSQAIQKNLSQLYALRPQGHYSRDAYRTAVAYQRINRIIYYNDYRTVAIKRPGVTIVDGYKEYAVSPVPMRATGDCTNLALPYEAHYYHNEAYYHYYDCSINWNEEPTDDIIIGRVEKYAFRLKKDCYERIKNYLKKTKQLNGVKCYVETFRCGAALHVYTAAGDIILVSLLTLKIDGEPFPNRLQPSASNSFYPRLYAAIASQINYTIVVEEGNFFLSETVTPNSLCTVLKDLIQRKGKLGIGNEVVDIFQSMINLMPFYENEQAKEIVDIFIDELNHNFLADTVKQQVSHSQDIEKPDKKEKGSPQNKYDINAQIRSLIDEHRSAGKAISDYTQDDIDLMLQYSGDGGNKNADIEKGGALNEYYTPDFVCEIMYNLAKKYGYTKGKVLEPSCAIGNMIAPFVKNGDAVCVDAFEVNDYTAEICEARFAKSDILVNVRRDFYETAFLQPPRFTSRLPKEHTSLGNAPYDVVIGNPPYGKHVNKYSSYFTGKEDFKQAEMFFISKSLDLLRAGGLLVFIVPCSVLANGISKETEIICAKSELVDAYRLPPVFGATNICTDIIVLRKK